MRVFWSRKRDGAPAEHVQAHLPGAVVSHHLLQRDILVLRHHLAELLEVLTVLRGGVEPERQRFFHRSHEFSVLFIVDEVDKIRRLRRRRVRRGRVRHLRHQNFIVRKPSKGREGRRELSDGLFDLRLERLHGGRERQRLIAEHELNLKRRKHRVLRIEHVELVLLHLILRLALRFLRQLLRAAFRLRLLGLFARRLLPRVAVHRPHHALHASASFAAAARTRCGGRGISNCSSVHCRVTAKKCVIESVSTTRSVSQII